MDLLNLDAVVFNDKKILFGGVEYVIPGELPLKLMLKIMRCAQEVEKEPNNIDKFEQAVDALADVFALRQAFSPEKFKNVITVSMYIQIVNFISKAFTPMDEKKTELPAEPTLNENGGQ